MKLLICTITMSLLCFPVFAGLLDIQFNNTFTSTSQKNSTISLFGDAINNDCCNSLTVQMTIEASNLPGDWDLIMITPDGSQPAGVIDASFTLGNSQTDVVGIDFNVGAMVGTGTVLVRFENVVDTLDFVEVNLTAVLEDANSFSVTFTDTSKTDYANIYIAVSGEIKNNTSDSVHITMRLSEVNVPIGWEVLFCDPYLCYPPSVVSANFSIAGLSEGGYVAAYFKANGIIDSGSLVLSFENTFDSTEYQEFKLFGKSIEPLPGTGISQSVDDNTPLMVYPNPFNESIAFRYSMKTPCTLTITDLTGREIERYQLTPGRNMEFKARTYEYAVGMYLYSLFSENRLVSSGKVNKVK